MYSALNFLEYDLANKRVSCFRDVLDVDSHIASYIYVFMYHSDQVLSRDLRRATSRPQMAVG